jgi:hypothetical protein
MPFCGHSFELTDVGALEPVLYLPLFVIEFVDRAIRKNLPLVEKLQTLGDPQSAFLLTSWPPPECLPFR